MIGRGARRLEVQPLHRGDAPVGPVGQHHQRPGRAIAQVADALAVVDLPQGAAAALVVADRAHLGDQLVELRVGLAALVALEVVGRPTAPPRPVVHVGVVVRLRVVVLAERAPRVHRVAVLVAMAPEGEHLVEPSERHQHHQCGRHRHHRAGRDPGDRGRVPSAGDVDEHRPELDNAHHHHQEAHEVQQRQDAGVPQQADHGEAAAGHVHHPHGHQSGHADRHPHHVSPRQRADEADDREPGDEDVERLREVEEHVPERVVGPGRPEAVLHVRHVLVVEQERPDPERRERQREDRRLRPRTSAGDGR